MTTYTPMMQQYLAVKEQAKDAILFFRLGDFYEMFFDDALEASRELEITLTGRDGGAEQRIPMCGVPYHSAESYIARLVDKGYKVAICEQVEDPAEAKGVVRREIVRIVTPGTVMDSRSLEGGANNYIAAITKGGSGYGLAACDITTGELYVTATGASLELLADELNTYRPSEIVAGDDVLELFRSEDSPLAAAKPAPVLTPRTKTPEDAALLAEHFGAGETDGLPDVNVEGLCILVGYLRETQKRALGHVKHIRRYEPNQYLIMDPFTRRNLELTETVRERSRKGSLLWLLDRTVTAMGARMLRRWIEKPLMNKGAIEERLEAVDALYRGLIAREDVRLALKDVYDLERLVGRIAYGSANARDLLALGKSLAQVPAVTEACRTSGSATLSRLAEQMDPCADIRAWIEAAIVDDPPVSVRDGGMIKDGYDAFLDQLREAGRNGRQWIAELERQEREATGIKSLKIGYNKVFGYFIEVTKANMGALPEGRYERKQTLANAERYVTPELKEKEALILEAQDKMVDLEYELFAALRDRIAAHIPRLQRLAERLAAVDALQSMAAVSAARHYRRPEVTDGYDLVVKLGRHPVVEAVMTNGAFIANDTGLTKRESSMLLITGPNMAGKSTYMRQVAVICLMAQIGCFVPAEEATVPLVDRIFTRIGAADDLIGGQSTFMVEMMDIQVMTEKATPRSLVIIDELGRGTSTGEGMAIAQAVIEFLHDQVGCKTLVSTHFHELAHLEDSLEGLRNVCMAVKESGRDVTFLRKLVPGAASTSYGIYCAQIAGLPESIIARSYELLSTFEARSAWTGPEAAGTPSAPGVRDKLPPAGAAAEAVPAAYGAQAEEEAVASASAVTAPQTAPADTAAGQAAAVVQLSLFPENADKPGRKKHDARAEQVLEQLKHADLINMTPLQALNMIYDLKQKLQDGR
ncbi:DNA mismatch repair protein MutS [Gordoniibacillus kamchatkensis]|uniref:DNA mismatch repair protein MutS n=1 Tax=Gordoniibacillus kamchatkensis TaxID=1590651 RepID=A0ABR5AEW5_9BACL|nr:DNA mismatch repair protein MutS [Paenibacillus sp. VKM B-2647]KIL39500.1 DNA mismatch repair protein MutS [Paenibacillus sp. VKM B-2647]